MDLYILKLSSFSDSNMELDRFRRLLRLCRCWKSNLLECDICIMYMMICVSLELIFFSFRLV